MKRPHLFTGRYLFIDFTYWEKITKLQKCIHEIQKSSPPELLGQFYNLYNHNYALFIDLNWFLRWAKWLDHASCIFLELELKSEVIALRRFVSSWSMSKHEHLIETPKNPLCHDKLFRLLFLSCKTRIGSRADFRSQKRTSRGWMYGWNAGRYIGYQRWIQRRRTGHAPPCLKILRFLSA